MPQTDVLPAGVVRTRHGRTEAYGLRTRAGAWIVLRVLDRDGVARASRTLHRLTDDEVAAAAEVLASLREEAKDRDA